MGTLTKSDKIRFESARSKMIGPARFELRPLPCQGSSYSPRQIATQFGVAPYNASTRAYLLSMFGRLQLESIVGVQPDQLASVIAACRSVGETQMFRDLSSL